MRLKEVLALLLLTSVAGGPALSQSASSQQATLRNHIRLAQQYLRERKPDLAVPELRAVIALDPKNVDARGNLGVLLFFRGDYAGAVPQLRAAIQLKPDLWKIEALLGISEERLGKHTEGRSDLATSFPHLKEEKFKMEVGRDLIDSYTSTGDLDKAAAIVSELLKLEPTDTSLLYTAYRLYSDLADETVVSMAMTAPDSAQMHEMMGRVLAREGDSAGAIANYREAIRLNPQLADLHFDLAELLADSATVEDQKAAVSEYKAALALNPLDEKSESELGKITAQNGDNKAAFEYYSEAVKMQPDDPAALTGLAKVLISMQQLANALPLLERAVQLDPTSAAAHFRLSTLYRHLGRPADANQQLDEYLRYKKMREQLSAIFKKMRLPQTKDAAGDSDATR